MEKVGRGEVEPPEASKQTQLLSVHTKKKPKPKIREKKSMGDNDKEKLTEKTKN